MNYQDMQQRLEAIQTLLSNLNIPASRQYIGTLAQIHYLLDSLRDECNNCLHQESMKRQDAELAVSEEGGE